MNPGGREKAPGVLAGDPHCFLTAPYAGAGDHHRADSSSKRAFNDLRQIRAERAVRQIDADINNVV
jgi:hypothetical protein